MHHPERGPLFGDLFGPREAESRSRGSGYVIDKAGHILPSRPGGSLSRRARLPGPRPFSLAFPAVEHEAREPGRLLLEDLEPAEEEEVWQDDDSADHSGWYCVSTEPFPCPAAGCSFVARFMTAAHLVLVWQERDDPNLLRHAERAKRVERNPRVVQYEPSFGPSVSYYAWEAAGRPVHGVRGK